MKFWEYLLNVFKLNIILYDIMCGIIGIYGLGGAPLKVIKGLEVIKERGRDCYGVFSKEIVFDSDIEKVKEKIKKVKSDFCLGHCLHSLVDFVPQPIKGKGVLVANCEIYNWKELNKKYNFNAKNDAEVILYLLDLKGISKIKNVLKELDGVYSFAYQFEDLVVIVRDIIGVKPLWYVDCEYFAFCSERKALMRLGIEDAKELNPREILIYDYKTKEKKFLKKAFFDIIPQIDEKYPEIMKRVEGLVINSISKRIPDEKFGILFSGGIDSTLIALICQKLGVYFVCYTAAIEDSDMQEPEDIIYAKKIAKEYGFKLKINRLSLDETEKHLRKLIPLIEDSNVVKVGVGLTFYAACELAQKDGVRVIFSGLGSEELFAGYERHKNSNEVNNECVSGLLKMYERDTYRDDVITMNLNIELRLPFLDKKLADYSLKIPAKYKLDATQNKKVLREVAEKLGLNKKFAQRRKKAAQYGSKFDKAIGKLAKKNGFKYKSTYLDQFCKETNPRIAVLFSSGKDSCYAMHIMKKQNYPISCLVTIKSKNPDSYMFHTPNIDLAVLQAEAMGLPIIVVESEGEKEKELKDMETGLRIAKEEYRVEGVVSGAIFSQYQRERVETVCDKVGLKIFSPLWHMDQEKEMRALVKNGFKFIFSSVAAEGLDKTWVGREINYADIDKLVELNKKMGLNIAGEGGETESLVLDGPAFKKKLKIVEFEIIEENKNIAKFIVKDARLVDK